MNEKFVVTKLACRMHSDRT